ncbi:MAG: ATP-grasp domain-containing protein [Myxococcales bacterium]|nr:ATP-grasp domain-containing protein [Myxococcales bacterium]
MGGPDRPHRIVILYNTDYDAELTAGTELSVSAVQASAQAIERALIDSGFATELWGLHGLEVCDLIARLRSDPPDLVFNLCESMAGDPRNEPTMTGILELYKIPYTGNGTLALGSCLHKSRTKDILHGRGIPTPPHRFLATVKDLEDPAIDELDYPWFLKLAHEDASVGITADNVVHSPAALRARAAIMMEEFGQSVLAERFIAGREVNVTMIGNGPDLQVLPLHEIDFSHMPADRPRIVSYAAKWEETHVDYLGTVPVRLGAADSALIDRASQIARATWAALGLADYARVDLRIDGDGNPWVIDVNPNCDISPDAGAARAAAAMGLRYPELVERVALVAWRRWKTPA